LSWFRKNILERFTSAEHSPDENQLRYFLSLFLTAGCVISSLLLLVKETIRTDLSNPVAETATILMFGSALFFLTRNKKNMAINMVFFIPLLVYLYYYVSFSNSAPLPNTLHYVLLWYLSGLVVMAFVVPFGTRYLLLYLMGIITLVVHIVRAGLSSSYFTPDQIYLFNPVLILTLSFAVIVTARIGFDRIITRDREQKQIEDQQARNIIHQIRQPFAQIKALRDQDGNIVRLEVVRINHAFESGFRITFPEARNQEVNYLFNFIFKNEISWNDLFIIDPKSQAEIFSPSLGKWFTLYTLWMNQETCFCLFNDITQEKIEIRHLEETRARYLTLLEAIPDIFFVIDRDGIFQDVVFKGQETLLPETSEVIGNSVFKVGFSEMMAEKIFQCIQKAIDHDTIETIEYTMESRNTSLLFEMRLARLNENSVISIARDITRRKKAEFELEAAKAKAEEADALKSKFLANLSHDIRTPMNIIMGLTKMLAEPSLSDFERDEFIHDVQQQGFSLLNIIENTIQLSKIETNTLVVNKAHTNIHALLRELFLHFYPLLPDHRDLQLILHTGIQSDEVGFETDPSLLKEALYRLIDNAIRFTPEGTVSFGYTPVIGNSVEFFVEDTGPGIPPSEEENIFLRFYVIESDRQAQKSGPGLGLPIAQHLVALLGGELKLDTTPGKGSRFWFRLPLTNASGFMRIVQ